MKLAAKHQKQLRRLGHQLKPVVRIARDGLKETVIEAAEEALEAHELIKIKVQAENREQQNALLDSLCRKTSAALVSQTGFTALLFRKSSKTKKTNRPGRGRKTAPDRRRVKRSGPR